MRLGGGRRLTGGGREAYRFGGYLKEDELPGRERRSR